MKDNKLLAEYLGFEMCYAHGLIQDLKSRQIYRTESTLAYNYPYWQPNKDWNQLMMVVEKIEETGVCGIFSNLCSISEVKSDIDIKQCADTKIEAVYNACVEYIK
ncbi:hypothetical protein ES705_19840 [subsurface metagenome]